jgi:MCP family monocarboxylic acid transporter-like MFS transporter 6
MIVLSGVILNCCVLGLLLRPTRYCRIIRRVGKHSTFHIELFSDWRFCLFCLSEILWNIGSLILLTAAPDHAYLKGTSAEKSALLLSISGFGGFVGRLLMAFLTNFKNCNRLLCLAMATLVTVFPIALFTVSDLYPVLAIHCLVYGLGFGFQLGLLAVVTLELFTVEKLTSAYGWVMLSDGIGAFLGPIITGTYTVRTVSCSPS